MLPCSVRTLHGILYTLSSCIRYTHRCLQLLQDFIWHHWQGLVARLALQLQQQAEMGNVDIPVCTENQPYQRVMMLLGGPHCCKCAKVKYKRHFKMTAFPVQPLHLDK